MLSETAVLTRHISPAAPEIAIHQAALRLDPFLFAKAQNAKTSIVAQLYSHLKNFFLITRGASKSALHTERSVPTYRQA
jgi:hypothetical protein